MELAELLGLSKGHFARTFKRAFGVSPHAYVLRRRIEVAQGLMLTTCEPLSSIALTCGMCDQSHLAHTFHRIVGETPDSWRRALLMGERDPTRRDCRQPLLPFARFASRCNGSHHPPTMSRLCVVDQSIGANDAKVALRHQRSDQLSACKLLHKTFRVVPRCPGDRPAGTPWCCGRC